ncbi:hypothetical protein BHM03_00058407 [Ensete ventricosum]|nr:hypothetical protein BHM03_00058407 [Ensete ventricosum]
MLGTYRSNRGPVCLVKLGTLVYHVSVCLKKKREKEKKSIKIPCALLFTGSPTWSIARAIPSPRTGRRIEATISLGAVREKKRGRKGELGDSASLSLEDPDPLSPSLIGCRRRGDCVLLLV